MAIRAEIMQKIFSDADGATPVDGKKNVYDPENYQKVMARHYALGLINNPQGDYLNPQVDIGTVEMDENTHSLKKIGRRKAKLIDVRRYTANRYYKEVIPDGTPGVPAGVNLVVLFGGAIVRAIAETRELPPTVKAFRFVHNRKDGWQYVRAEFIKSEVAYTLTDILAPDAAITLMHLIEDHEVKSAEVEGDSLEMAINKPIAESAPVRKTRKVKTVSEPEPTTEPDPEPSAEAEDVPPPIPPLEKAVNSVARRVSSLKDLENAG